MSRNKTIRPYSNYFLPGQGGISINGLFLEARAIAGARFAEGAIRKHCHPSARIITATSANYVLADAALSLAFYNAGFTWEGR